MKRLRLLAPAVAFALAGCAPLMPPPVKPAPATFSCGPAGDADFEGEGEQRLHAYLAWLAVNHGQPGLEPSQVSLAIVRSRPKPGPAGVQVGEISCGRDDYRITLYRDPLVGRPLAVTYGTLAHEFFHVVQIRRDQLACEAGKGKRAAYEREADEFSARVVPSCVKQPAAKKPPPTPK